MKSDWINNPNKRIDHNYKKGLPFPGVGLWVGGVTVGGATVFGELGLGTGGVEVVPGGGLMVGETGVGGAGARVEDLLPRISPCPAMKLQIGRSQHGLFGSCSR